MYRSKQYVWAEQGQLADLELRNYNIKVYLGQLGIHHI